MGIEFSSCLDDLGLDGRSPDDQLRVIIAEQDRYTRSARPTAQTRRHHALAAARQALEREFAPVKGARPQEMASFRNLGFLSAKRLS